MTTKTVRTSGPRTPIPFTDEDGIACLRVPLDDRGEYFAIVEQDDYDHIIKTLGCRAKWCRNGNGSGRFYVAVNPPMVAGRGRGLISVARLVAEAGSRQTVCFATSNTLDLRRRNLSITRGNGRARRNCATWLAESVKASNKAKAAKQGHA